MQSLDDKLFGSILCELLRSVIYTFWLLFWFGFNKKKETYLGLYEPLRTSAGIPLSPILAERALSRALDEQFGTKYCRNFEMHFSLTAKFSYPLPYSR